MSCTCACPRINVRCSDKMCWVRLQFTQMGLHERLKSPQCFPQSLHNAAPPVSKDSVSQPLSRLLLARQTVLKAFAPHIMFLSNSTPGPGPHRKEAARCTSQSLCPRLLAGLGFVALKLTPDFGDDVRLYIPSLISSSIVHFICQPLYVA